MNWYQGYSKYILFLLCLLLVAKNLEVDVQKRKEKIYEEDSRAKIVKTPMQVAATVMLGGFRVLLVDALWIRMIALQQKNENYEILLTAKLISDLQPDYESVWDFISWNMAFNISKEVKGIDKKFEWILKGIEYLDKGIKRNPYSAQMKMSKARIYFMKLGVYHEHALPLYYYAREQGVVPAEKARELLLQAVELGTKKVYAERELNIVNTFWVKELLFHQRVMTHRLTVLMKKRIESFSSKLTPEVRNEMVEMARLYQSYKSKFGEETKSVEMKRRIEIAMSVYDQQISQYPEQEDMKVSKETHRVGFKNFLKRFELLHTCEENLGKLLKATNDELRKNLKYAKELIAYADQQLIAAAKLSNVEIEE